MGYTSPYRGLKAMEEKDSGYFFGRDREAIDVPLDGDCAKEVDVGVSA